MIGLACIYDFSEISAQHCFLLNIFSSFKVHVEAQLLSSDNYSVAMRELEISNNFYGR